MSIDFMHPRRVCVPNVGGGFPSPSPRERHRLQRQLQCGGEAGASGTAEVLGLLLRGVRPVSPTFETLSLQVEQSQSPAGEGEEEE